MDNSLNSQIVVAMSGGVDSSVAALMLHKEGFSVVGVSMQVWDYRNSGGCESKASCCAPDDFTDARKVAARIGVPYYVFDFEKTFRKEVIDRFVSEYQQGLTPNPCVECNNKVKFRELRDRATSLGCKKVATGHYAQIKESAEGSRLMRAEDKGKDQSYFLYGIKPQELENTIFPVGHMQKSEVRELAREAGLVTADKPESQDICFVSGKVQDFLVKLGSKKQAGDIVLTDGSKIGQHDGIHNFTVGQRRGIKIGGNEKPLYVIEISQTDNRVIVGGKEDLERESFSVSELSWVSPDITKHLVQETYRFPAIAQVRSRHKGVEVEVLVKANQAEVFFKNEWATISPGQVAVFYDQKNEEVLGGGKIRAGSVIQ